MTAPLIGNDPDLDVAGQLERLRAARDLLREAAALTDEPAVYQAIELADMNLHWACWQLGSVEQIAPQLERTAPSQTGGVAP
jgi:hypothetical protein